MGDESRFWSFLVVLAVASACSSSQEALDSPPELPGSPPERYFYFSSDDDAVDVLSEPSSVEALGAATVVAGIDPGGDLESEEFVERADALREQGRRIHVYLEGPGGPTGDDWTPDECERIKAAATDAGVTVPANDDCGDDDSPWLREWNESAFLVHVERQLAALSSYDIYSIEIDNLARAGFGLEQRPLSELVALFAATRERAGSSARLLLKNIESSGELLAVLDDSERELLADYLILEEYLKDDWCAIAATARERGLTAAFSWDTYHFHAETDELGRDRVLAGPKRAERRRFACAGEP